MEMPRCTRYKARMPIQSVALVTARAARRLDEDLAPLEAALRDAGVAPSLTDWDDDDVDWASFDLALLRSPWDYTKRLPEFLQWAEHVATQTRLINPLEVVRWNTDKHYLAELSRAAVPTVPSHFVEPGEDGAAGLQRFFSLHPDIGEFVVKPAVGAGSRDARRYAREDADVAAAHAQRLLDSRRSVLLQPYLESVDTEGETALIYFAGRFSHAIRKGPLLKRRQAPTRALFAEEHIVARTPGEDERDVAAKTLAAVPFGQLLYARVDLIRDAAGAPEVLELEVTEPSMFFATAPGSAARFASLIRSSP
jgi:glutathione synthase/RimK-type ligase-like ATP-grasp enzyme